MLRSFVIALCLCLLANDFVEAQSDLYVAPVSKSRARLWSASATLLPMAVGAEMLYLSRGDGSDRVIIPGIIIGGSGLIFGPGAGHAYCGQWKRAIGGTAVRLVGVGVFLTGMATFEFTFADSASSGNGAGMLLLAGTVTVVISAIHDLTTVDVSVNKHNHPRRFSKLRLEPTYFASQKAPGVLFTFSF